MLRPPERQNPAAVWAGIGVLQVHQAEQLNDDGYNPGPVPSQLSPIAQAAWRLRCRFSLGHRIAETIAVLAGLGGRQ